MHNDEHYTFGWIISDLQKNTTEELSLDILRYSKPVAGRSK